MRVSIQNAGEKGIEMYQTTTPAGAAGRHALVLGGSMAGLAMVRVLTDHFDRVTIVDRDRFPTEPLARPGVPQSQHIHVMLLRGQMIWESLLPGLQSELSVAGAPLIDVMQDLAWLTPKGWGARFASNLRGYTGSRALLESSIHRRITADPRVHVLEEHVASGLVTNGNLTRVTGARIRPRSAPENEAAEMVVNADLVVDATGRGSRIPQWLPELGYPAPEQTVVDSYLGYASRTYRIPEHPPTGWKGIYIQQAPPSHLSGGVLYPVEGNRWFVTVAGSGKNYPPTDEDGFLEFARNLRSPLIYDAIRDAEPLSPIQGTRSTANVLRHYERLARFPDGLVVVGDAACAFNPVYGQGMTAAAMGAVLLDECLRVERRQGNHDLVGLSHRFQKKLAGGNQVPWLIATSEDLRVPATEGERPGRATQFMHRYLERVVEVSTLDPQVRLTLNEVISLVKPMAYLFHPLLVARVVRGIAPAGKSAPNRLGQFAEAKN